MSERALRGTRLGATSYETDSGIDLAPRQDVEYACPSGHRFRMPFSVEAEVPVVWECRVCGAQALRVGGVAEEDKPGKPARTHWDMLLERRSIPELEEVLAERLEVLRGGGFGNGLGARGRHAPVNLATGAPEPGAKASGAKQTAHTESGAQETEAQQTGQQSGEQAKPTGRGTRAATAKQGSAAAGSTGSAAKATATSSASTATKTTAAKKTPAKKTTAGTAPAKKTAASSKAAPATKTTDKPVKKPVAKKPSAK